MMRSAPSGGTEAGATPESRQNLSDNVARWISSFAAPFLLLEISVGSTCLNKVMYNIIWGTKAVDTSMWDHCDWLWFGATQ